MIFFYILWAVLFGFIMYGKFFRKVKPITTAFTLPKENINAGELYSVGQREVILFGKHKGHTAAVKNVILTILETDSISLENLYTLHEQRQIYEAIPIARNYMCHLVFHDNCAYYVADFYFNMKYLKKFEGTDSLLLTEDDC